MDIGIIGALIAICVICDYLYGDKKEKKKKIRFNKNKVNI